MSRGVIPDLGLDLARLLVLLPKGICLPETGDIVNLSMSAPHNEFGAVSSDLKSSDPEVVAKYFKRI